METVEIIDILDKFKNLPRFVDGRINYSNSNIAPVVTVFVEYDGKILLLKRSNKVRTYQGLWNTVAGYIDEERPIREIVLKELREELGINRSGIKELAIAESYDVYDKEINKTWIIHPTLVTLKSKPEIKLDWEHSEYCWIDTEEIVKFKTVYKLAESLKIAMNKGKIV